MTDPKAILAEQRKLAKKLLEWGKMTGGGLQDWVTDGHRLAELVLALDRWMSRGGFSPWSE
jgi:hypothetical protein